MASMTGVTALDRKIEPEPTSGCWIWVGARHTEGYGTSWSPMRDGRRHQRYVHRLVYELLVGPIPEGMTIDHLCRVRACVNPAHMEAVPLGVNVMRGESLGAQAARRTECAAGHPYPADVHRRRGARECRACRAEQRLFARLRAISGMEATE